MKTNFFLMNTLDEDDKKEFNDLLNSSEDLFNEIYSWFYNQESYPRITNDLTRDFAQKTGESPSKINNVIARTYRLINIFRDSDNEVENFIDDIKKNNPEIVTDEKVLIDRLTRISKISKKYDLFFKIEETLSLGTSALKGSSISVILKPVLNERYDQNKTNIKNYKPEILHYEPSVLFEMEKSDKEKFSFQMTPQNFERYLNHLISIQLELKAVSDGTK